MRAILRRTLPLLLCTGLGCASARAPRPAGAGPGTRPVLDWTHPMHSGMPIPPGAVPFTVHTRKEKDAAPHAHAAAGPVSYGFGQNVGTYIAAPAFVAGKGKTLDALPAGSLFGVAVVLDVSAQAEADPDYRLTPEDVRRWEKAHGAVPRGAVVVLRTGWAGRFGNPLKYRNADAKGVFHFPGFSLGAALFLLDARGARALAVDTLALGGARGEGKVRAAAAARDAWFLENLNLPDALTARRYGLLVAPLRVRGAAAAPARVLARPAPRKDPGGKSDGS
jgi:kynurenine formamidase